MIDEKQKKKFYSLYWANVDQTLVAIQKDIFQFFNINIEQHLIDKQPHGQWIDNLFANADDDDIITIVDIDCFPLNNDIIDKSINIAKDGGIFGCAQVANHLQPDFIYAGPMYLTIKAKTWRELGKPSFQETEKFDVGGYLTFLAQQKKIPIHFAYPNTAAINRWALSDICTFGIFTIYEDSILHLFESRQASVTKTIVSLRDNLLNDFSNFNYQKFVTLAANEYCNEIANGNIPSYRRSKFLKKFFSKK